LGVKTYSRSPNWNYGGRFAEKGRKGKKEVKEKKERTGRKALK